MKQKISSIPETNGTSRRLFIKDAKILLDSGADISVLPKNVFHNHHENTNFVLSAANGANIYTYGSNSLTLNLGVRRLFTFPFIIASVDHAIIGADFLFKFDLLLDLGGRRLVDQTTYLSSICQAKSSETPTLKLKVLQGEFNEILNECPGIKTPPNFTLPVKHGVKYQICTEGELPVSRPRRLNPAKLKIAKDEFQHMLNLGICHRSSSSCSSPLHMVH